MRQGTRAGKPVDDFEDDQTGDRGDDAATAAAARAVSGAEDGDGEDGGEGEVDTSSTYNTKTSNSLGVKSDKLQQGVSDWEEQQAEIDAIMDEAKTRCQPFKDEQKHIAKALAEGSETEPAIPKAVFKAALIIRRHEAKKHRTLRKLNDDQRDELLALAETEGKEGLVPLPLYQWAIEQKKAKPKAASRRSTRH